MYYENLNTYTEFIWKNKVCLGDLDNFSYSD